MEIIITESQLSLLLEQSNVYTDKSLYDKALKKYNRVWEAYNKTQRMYDYFKNGNILIPSSIKITLSNRDLINNYLWDDFKKKINIKDDDEFYEIIKIMKSNKILPKFDYYFRISTTPQTSDKYFKIVEYRGSFPRSAWTKKLSWVWDFYVYNTPTIPKPIYKAPEPVVEPNKTPPVVNYRELKSETSFAPHIKSGTPIVQVGTYYMTYPEFETYKKSKPNTKFNKQ
jgi:hypothetical protein